MMINSYPFLIYLVTQLDGCAQALFVTLSYYLHSLNLTSSPLLTPPSLRHALLQV
jgi:hypothetical protein